MFLTGCSLFPNIKWPTWGKGSETITEADGRAANQALKQITEADRKIQEAKLKLEQEYDKFRKDLEEAYKKREELDLANFQEVSKINYGIYYVTDNEKKVLDTDFLIAHLRAKENMTRLDQLPEPTRQAIRDEVDEDRKKAIAEIEKKYEQKIKEGIQAALNFEKASKVIAQKEEEKRKLLEENKLTVARMEQQKYAELEKIKKDTEYKIAAAKEEQRLEMLRWIVKALAIIGILQLVIGLLLKSPMLIISGIFTLGMAYVAVMVPFWVVVVFMAGIVLCMTIVNPKTGKCEMITLPLKKVEPAPAKAVEKIDQSPKVM